MKRYLAALCIVLLAFPALAATPAEEAGYKAWAVATGNVAQFCNAKPAAQHFVANDGTFVHDDTYAITSWTGGCVKGKRDGFGALTAEYKLKHINPPKSDFMNMDMSSVNFNVTEGTFVRGQAVGLWCTREAWYRDSKNEVRQLPLGCRVQVDAARSSLYRKLPDGRWQLFNDNGTEASPASFTAPNALEAEAARIIALARAGKPTGTIQIAAQTSALADLVRGGAVVMALNSDPLALPTKRVAIVLSSGTLDALTRYNKMRQDLIDKSNGLDDEYGSRKEYIEKSDSKWLLNAITNGVRANAREVVGADDLSILQNGGADYAVVVDWNFDGDFALSERDYKALQKCDFAGRNSCKPLLRTHLTAWLIDRKLRAVRRFDEALYDDNFVYRDDDDYDDHFTGLRIFLEMRWKSDLNSMTYQTFKNGLAK